MKMIIKYKEKGILRENTAHSELGLRFLKTSHAQFHMDMIPDSDFNLIENEVHIFLGAIFGTIKPF